MKPFRKFNKIFQIRWKEKLGEPDNPYLHRWTLILFGFSIRLHHWMRSDDNRYFHDHSTDLISIVLKGYYWNVKPTNSESTPFIPNINEEKINQDDLNRSSLMTRDETFCYVEGMFNSFNNFKHYTRSIWYSNARDRHYLLIPKGGAWTLLLCSRPYHKWGFYVPNHKTGKLVKWRPLRYFHKFGIRQDKDYQ